MAGTLRRLALGLGLIAAASSLLLFSDLGSRRGEAEKRDSRVASVALLQHASQAILDQGRDGMIAGLAERGWVKDQNLKLRLFNAEGDMTVSPAIATEMVNGGNDLLMTISTPSLQAVANANRTAQVNHVFGLVANPYAAGVGVTSPTEHPAWLTGCATMQPVKLAFEIARKLNPQLKTVGVAWNASEANAEAQVKVARKVCADMGIDLVELTVENSAGVGETAAALVSRGVEAIWVCGDVTVMTAIDTLIAAANRGEIPVFTVVPPNVKRGALFDIGADYFEVGRLTGLMAGDVLNGTTPASIPVENVMPEIFTVNLKVLSQLKSRWTVPEDLVAKARTVIAPDGTEKTNVSQVVKALPTKPAGPAKKWKLAVIAYNENPPTEETLAGMKDQWARSSFKEGRDYVTSLRSAQGDIAALSGILDAALTEGADIVIPLSTPTLQSAINKVKKVPVVFSLIANPVAAGAGKSYTDHLPNVTGVSVLSPAGDMLDLLEKYYPKYKTLGTLFCPAEANSVDLVESFSKMCAKRGFTLVTVAANSASELADAAQSLASRPIDAIVQISDNLSSAGFVAIAKAARQTRKPLLSLNSTTASQGAPIAMGRDYHYCGEVTVQMIEEIMRGADPSKMPFVLPPKVMLTVSPANAEAIGMPLPAGLVKEAGKVLP